MRHLGFSGRRSEMTRILVCVGLLATVAGTARSQDEKYLEVYRLQNSAADEVAKSLEVLVPGAVVNEDPKTNMIHVIASKQVHQQVAAFIRQLDGESTPRRVQIVVLQHRPAEDATKLLNEILKDDPRAGDVNIIADDRANALIIRSTEEDFHYVEELVRVIDADQTSTNRQVKLFPLKHADATAAGELLSSLFVDKGQFAVDSRSNSLVVTGDEGFLAVVEAVLQNLDAEVQPAPKELEQLQIRILWIVGGADWTATGAERPDLAAIPDDLADVAGELESLGIGDPRIATQMVVHTSGQFSISGSARLENSIQVIVQGSVALGVGTGAGSRPTLDISIDASDASVPASFGRPQAGRLCELETTLKAPLGQIVVLGVSPIDSKSSAFVVQVLSTEK